MVVVSKPMEYSDGIAVLENAVRMEGSLLKALASLVTRHQSKPRGGTWLALSNTHA
jgi:hypothetical protein